MKETLECTQCDKKWERKKARGRKPVVCPDCADFNQEQASEQKQQTVVTAQENYEPTNYTFPPVSYWMCPNCDQTISVHVGLNHVPIHPCKFKRSQMLAFVQTTRQRLKEVTA